MSRTVAAVHDDRLAEHHDPDSGGGPVVGIDPSERPGFQAGLQRHVPLRAVLILVAVAAVGLVYLSTTNSPYVLMRPGPTYDLTDRLEGGATDAKFGTGGEMLLTTVEVEPLRWFEWAAQKVSPDPHTQIVDGGAASSGPRHVAGAQMITSKQVALAKAVELAGLGGAATADGVVIADVFDGSPAQAAGLRVGDVVVSVDGGAVTGAEQLSDAIAASTGAVVLGVERDGTVTDVSAAPEPGSDGRRIGVQITPRVVLPDGVPSLDADLRGVGGSSGGLMLTLAFLDALSPGDLTGGRNLAGTGTMDVDGTVGPIAGIEFKVPAAVADGAEVFFAPADNAASIPADPGAEVVVVSTVSDALAWLCGHGATDAVCATMPPRP